MVSRGRRISTIENAVKQVRHNRDSVEVTDVHRDIQINLMLASILSDLVGLGSTGSTFRTLELADGPLERGTSKQRVRTATTDLLEDRLEDVVELRLRERTSGAGTKNVRRRRAERCGNVGTRGIADPLAEGAGLVRRGRGFLLAVIIGTDTGFDIAFDFAHGLHFGIRDLAGHASNVRSLLKTRNHPLFAELLDVIAQTSAIDGLIGERKDILTFQHATEVNGGKGVHLPFLIRIRHAFSFREGRNLRSILGSEDGQEICEVFTITGNIVSSR